MEPKSCFADTALRCPKAVAIRHNVMQLSAPVSHVIDGSLIVDFSAASKSRSSSDAMKVSRGALSTGLTYATDEKSLVEVAKDWWPGERVNFDGTVDKSGTRHTRLSISLEEEDILALHAGVLDFYRRQTRELTNERDRQRRTIQELEDALYKMHKLVSWNQDRAPNTEELLQALEEITEHFRWRHHRQRTFKSRFKWLRWKSL